MLTFAFANEVLDEVACSVVKLRIEAMVQAWLAGVVNEYVRGTYDVEAVEADFPFFLVKLTVNHSVI